MARKPTRARRALGAILAPYLTPRADNSGSRRGQGVILTWDAATGANTVSFRGREYVNMGFQTFGTIIPTYIGGDIVVIDGWAPEGRLSSWYIIGRIVIPPITAPEA